MTPTSAFQRHPRTRANRVRYGLQQDGELPPVVLWRCLTAAWETPDAMPTRRCSASGEVDQPWSAQGGGRVLHARAGGALPGSAHARTLAGGGEPGPAGAHPGASLRRRDLPGRGVPAAAGLAPGAVPPVRTGEVDGRTAGAAPAERDGALAADVRGTAADSPGQPVRRGLQSAVGRADAASPGRARGGGRAAGTPQRWRPSWPGTSGAATP